jgi:hypothetical protein
MKRAILALTTASVIILLMLIIVQVSVVEANPFSVRPGLYVRSPASSHIYVMDPIVSIFFFYSMEDNLTQISFSYSLNSNTNSTLGASLSRSQYGMYYYVVSNTIDNLADGDHTLTVYAHCSNGSVNYLFNTIITVDAKINMPVVISPLNRTTYNTNRVPLTYAIDKKILWSYYSVDSTNNSDLKNFNGNITLPILSEGQHTLTLAVTTNTSTVHQTIQTIIFSISTTAPSPTVPEFPITVSLVTVLAAVSLLLVLGKRITVINH